MRFGIVATSLLSVATPLYACEACREALGKLGLARAYNWSVLLMLGVPVLVIAVISGVVIKAYRGPARKS